MASRTTILTLLALATTACSSDGGTGRGDEDGASHGGASAGSGGAAGGASTGATSGGGVGAGAAGATSGSGGGSGMAGAATASGGASGGAGGASGGAGGAAGGGSGGGAAPEPVAASGCDGRLTAVGPAGHVEVVGDGSAGSCTEQALHDAVLAVNDATGGGTVSFDCGGEHSIVLSRSVYVSNTLILDGGGEITLSGGGAVRVLELDNYVDFVVQRITIRDGFVPAGSPNESGAGLLHPWFGTLHAIDVTFIDNHSESQANDVGGGGLYAGGLTEAVLSGCTFSGNSGSIGGGVLSRSTNLRVVDSVFADNSATTYADSGQYGNGGGLYIDRMWLDAPVDFVMCGSRFSSNHAMVHGSAMFSYNLEGAGARFDRCLFENNDMAGSPGGGTGSVYHEGVPLTLVASTFAGNSTGAHAGGLFLGGGTDALVENCTFVGNRTPGNAGALWAGNGVVDVRSSTFAENDADYGPVIFKGSTGAVTLTSTVFSSNTTANAFSALACHETFADGGGNLQWPDTKESGSADTPCAAGVTFADPALQPLAANGGPTPTMALASGSPAIDVGASCPATDQRGVPRDASCDAGAFELAP